MAKNKHKNESRDIENLKEEIKKLKLENETLKQNTKYQMQYGLICIIDALGTKGVWRQDNPGAYIEKLKNIRESIIDYKNNNLPKEENLEVKVHSFSDTFFISAQSQEKKDIWDEKAIDVIFPWFSRMLSYIFTKSFTENIFFRGAFSCGKFYRDEDFVIGPAVDDAYYFSECFDMFGIVCTPSTSYKVEYSINFLKSRGISDETDYFIKYNVPIKKEVVDSNHIFDTSLLCINWPIMHKDISNNTEESLIKQDKEIKYTINASEDFKSYLGEYPIPTNAYNKYLETIKFYDHCMKLENA